MIAPKPASLTGRRFVDEWPERETREGSEVVAELRNRAPARIRKLARPLTATEQRLWRHLSDRAWFGTDVFSQVPVYLPECDLGCVFTFFVPRFRLAIQVDEFDPSMGQDEMIAYFDRCIAQDERMRDHGRIATMRCPSFAVRRDPKGTAESIRHDLGLATLAGVRILEVPCRGGEGNPGGTATPAT